MSSTAEQDAVHVFDNGISVYQRHLIPAQVQRYARGENLHEPEEERLFVGLVRECSPSGLFLDVGAAVGYYAILALRSSPTLRVHAFEPYSLHREYLAENVALNGLGADAVVVHAEAVGAARNRADFQIKHYGSSLVKPAADRAISYRRHFNRLLSRLGIRRIPERDGQTVEVPVITLDDFLREQSGAELIKVDVQGFETDVLKGATESMKAGRIARWLIGTHGREIHAQCAATLREHDYKIEIDEPIVKGQPDGVIVARKE